MKKTQNFVMRQVIDEYVMVPRGETAERIWRNFWEKNTISVGKKYWKM